MPTRPPRPEAPGPADSPSAPGQPAWIGIGANLGDARAAVAAAAVALGRLPGSRLQAVSSVWRSAPVDAAGPDFFNAVALLQTTLSPEDLLAALQGIEQAFGRQRPYHHAPRTLDLDLLLHGQSVRTMPALTLPHPRLHRRAFVLRPLLEVSPGLSAPGLGRLDQWLPGCAGQAVQRLD